MTEQQAMRLALEALELCTNQGMIPMYLDKNEKAITALRQALEQQPVDPIVGTKTWFEDGKIVQQELKYSEVYKQPAAWVSLTDVEIKRIGNLDWDSDYVGLWYDFAKAIEAKLKEKNT